MKRYKKRQEKRLVRKAGKTVKGLPWNEAVAVLSVAVVEAIWQEGGEREDALATADIIHHFMHRELNDWFNLEDRSKPINVVPFRRKRSYMR